MKALLTDGNEGVCIGEMDAPTPGKGEILVKVSHVAQNPSDWYGLDLPAGRVVGCDFVGTVVDSNGSRWAQGLRVGGWVHGKRADPVRGAFAEYLVTESDMVFPVPAAITDQQAATVPAAFATAVQAMVLHLKLPEPKDHPDQDPPATAATPFLINGGSTSVGMYAIQFAKLCGLYVVATGSRNNHALLKSLGADVVVDYSSSNWAKRVRRITSDGLQHALNCVDQYASILSTIAALSPAGGGQVVSLLPVGPVRESGEVDEDKVKLESMCAYSAFGRPFPGYDKFDNHDGPTPDHKALWDKYIALLPELLRCEKIRPSPVRFCGTIDNVPAGFEEQRNGNVKAEKLVYTIG